MKPVLVTFPSGRELLNAYWGLLANGGLVLQDPQGLSEGDRVVLEVTIASSQTTYRLAGQVVRRPQDASGRDRVVIAFNKGEPHDLLLSAAWAETENVPARKERRFPLDVDVRFRARASQTGDEHKGRLVNLSFRGCCLRVSRNVDATHVSVGQPLLLVGDGHELEGVIRWSNGSCRGIEFETADETAVKMFMKQYL